MIENDLLEPELLYKRELKEKHHQNTVDLFDELVKKSGIDVEANKLTCEKIYSKQSELKRLNSKLNGANRLKNLFIVIMILGIISVLFGIIFLALQIPFPIYVMILMISLGTLTIAGAIVLMVLVSNRKEDIGQSPQVTYKSNVA